MGHSRVWPRTCLHVRRVDDTSGKKEQIFNKEELFFCKGGVPPTTIYVAEFDGRPECVASVQRCGLAVTLTVGSRCDVVVTHKKRAPMNPAELAAVRRHCVPRWSLAMLNRYLAFESARVADGQRSRVQLVEDRRTGERNKRRRLPRGGGGAAKKPRRTSATAASNPSVASAGQLPFATDSVRTIPDAWLRPPAPPGTTFDDQQQVHTGVAELAALLRETFSSVTGGQWESVVIEVAVWMTTEQRQRWRRFPHVLVGTWRVALTLTSLMLVCVVRMDVFAICG